MKKFRRKGIKGQAITEYIIIIAVIALGALVVLGIFSDTLRKKIGGAASSLDNDAKTKVSTELDKSSVNTLQDLDKEGVQADGN